MQVVYENDYHELQCVKQFQEEKVKQAEMNMQEQSDSSTALVDGLMRQASTGKLPS